MINKIKKWVVQKALSKLHSHTWSTFYSSNHITQKQQEEIVISQSTALCEIMNANGSDKGRGWHNYTRVYAHLFQNISVKNLFELGIGTNNLDVASNMGETGIPGASLRGWKSYFHNASIYGADIDGRVLVNEERIQSFICDQTNTDSINNMWDDPSIPDSFEVMVDDGLHEFTANITFFENSIHKLAKGGIYVVEDINNFELGDWKKKIEDEYVTKYPDLIFRVTSIPNLFNALDNNLLVIYKT